MTSNSSPSASGLRGCGLSLALIGAEVFGLILWSLLGPTGERWLVGIIAASIVVMVTVVSVIVLRR